MSAVSSIFHVVINTYRRQMTIPDETSEHLYRYIGAPAKPCVQEDYQMLASKKPTGLRPAVRLRRLSPAKSIQSQDIHIRLMLHKTHGFASDPK